MLDAQAVPVDAGGGSAAVSVFSDLLAEGSGADVVLIPAERVALHLISLPLRTARQRQEALPFALEDLVAGPLEGLHFAAFGAGAAGSVLAAVVGKVTFEAAMADAPGAAVIPEQVLVPPPDAGPDGQAVWRACRRGQRVLVRVSDGTGFAAQHQMLPRLWQSAGKPAVESIGAPLCDDITWTDYSADAVTQTRNLADFDMRQGAYRPARGLVLPLKWLAACLVLGTVGHLIIAGFDLRAYRALADGLNRDASAALAPLLPAASADDAPAVILRQLAAQNQSSSGSGFLLTLDRVAQALVPSENTIQFRQLTWEGETLRMTVEAPDLAALQQAEARLRDAQLEVSSGSATAEGGAARADVTVRQ